MNGYRIDYGGKINVRAYGAKGDGVTDDTVDLQTAVTAALAQGATLYWPQGDYLTSAPIADLAGVRHQGPGRIERSGELTIGVEAASLFPHLVIDLPDQDVTIQSSEGAWRAAFAPYTASRVITLGDAAADEGDVIYIVRIGTEGYTTDVVETVGGATTLIGTLATTKGITSFRFDGANWGLWTREKLPT